MTRKVSRHIRSCGAKPHGVKSHNRDTASADPSETGIDRARSIQRPKPPRYPTDAKRKTRSSESGFVFLYSHLKAAVRFAVFPVLSTSRRLLDGAQRERAVTYLLSKGGFLFRGAVLEELLDNIIPENVGHERIRGGEDLLEHELLLAGGGAFQFLLDES